MPVNDLQQEVKAHKAHVQALEAKLASAAIPAVSTTNEDAVKDAASLRLYEDITELLIANVKVIEGGKNGKETIYHCVQTHGARSESIHA